MRAIYKAPGQEPQVIDIETLTFASDACLISNADGPFNDQRFNVNFCGAQIFGPLLIVGTKADEFTSLKRAEEVLPLLFGEGKR